jgi:hypothetical protein
MHEKYNFKRDLKITETTVELQSLKRNNFSSLILRRQKYN